MSRKLSITLILDNIRSVHNVGSLFRSGECFGVTDMYLCGTTPTPIDRFGRARPDMAKVALGAETLVNWEYFPTTEQAIQTFCTKNPAGLIIGLEQGEGATLLPMQSQIAATHIALVVGEETKGLPPEIQSLCDQIWEIPQWGEKESLNVSNAGAIALYEIRRIMI